jgi:hypothetical protein
VKREKIFDGKSPTEKNPFFVLVEIDKQNFHHGAKFEMIKFQISGFW